VDVSRDSGRDRQLGDRCRPRPPVDSAPLLGDAARSLPGARLRVRVLRRRSLSVVPGVVRHLSRRPGRRAGHRPVSVEDRVPPPAGPAGLRAHERARLCACGRGVSRCAVRACHRAVPAGPARPQRLLHPVPGSDLRVPPASHRPLSDARERKRR
jgi:hypothetical protein